MVKIKSSGDQRMVNTGEKEVKEWSRYGEDEVKRRSNLKILPQMVKLLAS